VIELATAGGVAFSGMESSTDPVVRAKMVYLSGPNGTELYRALWVPHDADSASYNGGVTGLTERLETQFATPAPAGDVVEIFNGCAFVASGDTVFFSDPYALERFRPRTQHLRFPAAVTMFAAVNDGVFVATRETTWFLEGGHASGFKSREVLDYGAIPGTAAKATVGTLKALEEAPEGATGGKAVFWTTPRGVCVGVDGGVTANLTERDVSFPAAPRGAGIVRQARGYTQYLAALEGAGVASNSFN
jgi:hypothetical protein